MKYVYLEVIPRYSRKTNKFISFCMGKILIVFLIK